ncbi:MAG: hypothetical protein ACRYG2_22455, partial [Janthinobacterium lividum]
QVDHQASGAGRALVTRTSAGRTTVMPLVAEPYLKRFLDPGLFDVDTLAKATGADGRLAVRIAYRGATPPVVPGVQVTSAADGTAHGNLTPTSAAVFGRALATQFQTDRKAGWPQRTTLFGVTGISADAPSSIAVTPKFPMLTLVIKVVGSDGEPAPFAFLGFVNVDDGRKYGGFTVAEDGEARVSVPAGHYAFVSDEYDGSLDRIATRDEYPVSRAGQVVTLDFRTATSRSWVSTPKPSSSTGYSFEWDRSDARNHGGLSAGFGLDSPVDVRVTPSARPKIGRVAVVQSFTTAQPATDDPAYTYDLASVDDHVAADLGKRFTPADLGTVGAVYHGDGATKEGAFGRGALYPTSGGVFISLAPVARPTTRTEYVGSLGSERPVWFESGLLNDDSFEDPGFVDAAPRAIPASSFRDERWFQGPLAPAVPIQTSGAFCWDCRTGNTMTVAMPPFIDGDPTHVGELFGAADGLPVARFRLYRGSTLLTDEDDAFGAQVDVPAAASTYRAVLDVDRRLSDPVLSTRTQTEWTFRSARNAGPAVPKGWFCDTGQDGCRTLPVVQARVKLPTDLQGQLPAGRSTVVVLAGQAQGSARSVVTSATLEVRGQGDDWQTVPLKSTGAGRYTAVVDNAEYSGTVVDVRVSTADQAGGTFRQTTLRAYRVAS